MEDRRAVKFKKEGGDPLPLFFPILLNTPLPAPAFPKILCHSLILRKLLQEPLAADGDPNWLWRKYKSLITISRNAHW